MSNLIFKVQYLRLNKIAQATFAVILDRKNSKKGSGNKISSIMTLMIIKDGNFNDKDHICPRKVDL